MSLSVLLIDDDNVLTVGGFWHSSHLPRCIGPQRAVDVGLRPHIEKTGARKTFGEKALREVVWVALEA
jgi:hypothetical protein